MEFRLPELGEGVYEAELTRWLATVGDQVAPGQGLLEVLTDKATMEVPAPFAGVITTLAAEPGQRLKIGERVLDYDPVDEAATAPPPVRPKQPAAPVTAPAPDGKEDAATRRSVPAPVETATKAAPAVRQMARQMGIDLAAVRGSGPEGRVLVDDLKTAAVAPAGPAPTGDFGRPGTRVKLQGIRRKIAEHMVEAKRAIPHYTYVDECDVTELVRVRNGLRDAFAARGVKLTYLAFLARAVARALRDVPVVNATFDEKAQELVLHDRYDLGIAVATPSGLVVPVLKSADRLGLFDVAREIERLSNDARAGKTRVEDLRGGTFTITSIGNIGGLFATPIIHHPQVGILGLGKIVQRPVFDAQGRVVAADMVYLSFSFDHRVLDGAVGAAFGNAVIKQLRKPHELAIDLD